MSALTKAEMAEKLYEELGFNKREAKELVELVEDVAYTGGFMVQSASPPAPINERGGKGVHGQKVMPARPFSKGPNVRSDTRLRRAG